MRSNGFRDLSAGDQLRPDVHRSGIGADAGRCASLGSLADELYTAASAYQSVVSELASGVWSGPSSTAMSAAGATYVEWLSATAAQAEEPPPKPGGSRRSRGCVCDDGAAAKIVANRSLSAVLVATNILGQSTPAIAATEAHYAEMWAQDALAMYGYAGSSAAATALTPFTSPQQNTDPSGTASQAAAVSQASGTSAGNVQGTISSVPQALSAAVAPARPTRRAHG